MPARQRVMRCCDFNAQTFAEITTKSIALRADFMPAAGVFSHNLARRIRSTSLLQRKAIEQLNNKKGFVSSVHEALLTSLGGIFGRLGGIRTRDPLHPMQVRYQAALQADVFKP